MAQQTAVEWLEQQLYKAGWEQLNHEEKMNICCTAKMMERDEIVEAFGDGAMDTLQLGNEYYNYLYNKNL